MADRIDVRITGDASDLIDAASKGAAALGNFGTSASKLSSIASAFKSDFGQMTAAFATANVAVGAIVGVFNAAAQAVQAMNAEVIDAERVSAKLTATFAGAEGAAARLTAQAEALAGSTVFFDDDAIKSAAAALRAFDLTENQISQLLPVAVNLATVFGTDLDSAAQKLALGLNGSTRGLREFGIVMKEGATQGDIMAEILKRGEQAAKGAATAQSGLRGATEGLKKAQGEFNQALGNLLAGPQAGFLTFLSSAINKATELTGALSGVRQEMMMTARVINPKTGQIEGGVPIVGPKPGQRFGDWLGLPKSTVDRFSPQVRGGGGGGDRVAQPPATGSGGSGRGGGGRANHATRAPGIDWDAVLRFNDEWTRRQERILEDTINANMRIADEQFNAAQDVENMRDDAQMKRNQDLSRMFDEEVAAAKKANDALLMGLADVGSIIAGVISGKGDFSGLAKLIATSLGGVFGGPVGSALAGAAADIAGAIAGKMFATTGKGVEDAANQLSQAGKKLEDAATEMSAAERERRIEMAKAAARARGLTEEDIARALTMAKAPKKTGRGTQSISQGQFAMATAPGVLPGYVTTPDIPGVGTVSEPFVGPGAPVFVQGPQGPEAPTGQEPAKLDTTAAFNDLVSVMRELLNVTLDEAGAGMTAREPLYVFDVSPSKDEFTRAPRGLFFRPVQAPRAVSGGQAIQTRGVAGISGGSSKRYG